MAIVTGKSNLAPDYLAGDTPPDPEEQAGGPIYATGTVANAATDSAGSMYKLTEVPADAIPHPDTFFDVTSWGFAQIEIGTQTDATALVNQTQATASIVQPIAQGGANHGKRWWEILGLAASPGGMIGIWAHAAANAAAAGTMPFQVASIWRHS